MIHAAIMGSLERFMSIFIEHHAGLFPLWLAPTQVALLPLAKSHEEYASTLGMRLMENGIRIEHMNSEQSLSKRIRDGEQQRIPYLLVLGDRELQERAVAVRNVATKQQVTVPFEAFLEKTVQDVQEKRLKVSVGG